MAARFFLQSSRKWHPVFCSSLSFCSLRFDIVQDSARNIYNNIIYIYICFIHPKCWTKLRSLSMICQRRWCRTVCGPMMICPCSWWWHVISVCSSYRNLLLSLRCLGVMPTKPMHKKSTRRNPQYLSHHLGLNSNYSSYVNKTPIHYELLTKCWACFGRLCGLFWTNFSRYSLVTMICWKDINNIGSEISL